MTVDELDNGEGHEGPSSDPPEPLPEPGVDVHTPSLWRFSAPQIG